MEVSTLALSKNVGTCFLCHKIISNMKIVRHLNDCVKKDAEINSKECKPTEIFIIKIFSNRTFWLYVEMPSDASLQYLDDFPRAVWLECCRHLSEFNVLGSGRCSKGEIIKHIFKKGTEFSCEYDFGSTTLLHGEVIDCYYGYLDKKIRLLARNNMPELKCTTCSSSSKYICSLCYRLCCSQCCQQHKCGKKGMLPTVNSPRMGICKYMGEIEEIEEI